MSSDRPNVLFIMTDQQRFDTSQHVGLLVKHFALRG